MEYKNSERKLGRGISSLISNSGQLAKNYRESEIIKISLDKIVAGVYQPRKIFDETEINDLARSIEKQGIIQPIIVRKCDEDKYEIIAGERRFKASKLAKKEDIPCIVKKINNHEALEVALIENVQRSDLTSIEEAYGYQRLMNEFAYKYEDIASKTGKSLTHIINIIRLLLLPKEVQDMISDKRISMGHARAIIKSANPIEFANKIIEDSLSVRDTEELIRTNRNKKKSTSKNSESDYAKTYESQLKDRLDMKVKINFNNIKRSGKIIITVGSEEEIEKLIKLLN